MAAEPVSVDVHLQLPSADHIISSSCLECRTRKVKCDRGDPCSHCVARNVVCRKEVLRKPNRKRGRHSDDPLSSSGQTSSWNTSTTADGQRGEGSVVVNGVSPGLHPALPVASGGEGPFDHFDWNAMSNDLNDVLFSSTLMNQLFGLPDPASRIEVAESEPTSGPSAAPMVTTTIGDVSPQTLTYKPLDDGMCIRRFNYEAKSLPRHALEEYREILPRNDEIDAIVHVLQQRTSFTHTRSDLNSVMDINAFQKTLCLHKLTVADPGTSDLKSLPAIEVFYITCALFYAHSTDKRSDRAEREVLPLVIKLGRQLTGLEASLMLLQAFRLWSMGCMQLNMIDEAASAVVTGSRAAISMGIHKRTVMGTYPAEEQAFLRDALVNLLCDACVMRAVLGIETPIDPTAIDVSLFVSAEELATEERNGQAESDVRDVIQRSMPLILRMHVGIWVFIERYYHKQGRLQVPTEQFLTAAEPVDGSDAFELSQLSSLNTFLHNCSQELERPLSSWLSAGKIAETAGTSAQSNKALLLLYLIRYYRILINFPFINIHTSSRTAVMETCRSTINSTWRLARHSQKGSDANLELYGCICLRAIFFLLTCHRHQQQQQQQLSEPLDSPLGAHSTSSPSVQSAAQSAASSQGAEHIEQTIADVELGVDALEKLDTLLSRPSRNQPPLASLASTLLTSHPLH